MRAALVIQMVEAFHQGTSAFRGAVEQLADEEQKKGNSDLAEKLRSALSQKSVAGNVPRGTLSGSSHNVYSPSRSIPSPPPKDKDSSLTLFETIEPTDDFEHLFYPADVSRVFQQVILEWKKSEQLKQAGMVPSRRILLHGPSGCGKTIGGMALAKAIGMPVAYVRLDGLFSSFLGQTSSNLRRVFESVLSPPRVLFLDEFDAVAKKRDDNQEIGEIKRIVISLLQNLDFLPPEILVIAATNHEHLLDPAIWRRFDISLNIGLPEKDARKAMIDTWLNAWQSKVHVDTDLLATVMNHFSVARIKNVVFQTIKNLLVLNEASEITTDDFIQQLIFSEGYNHSKESLLSFANQLRDAGMTLTNIAHITSIPKSTINDHTGRKGKKWFIR